MAEREELDDYFEQHCRQVAEDAEIVNMHPRYRNWNETLHVAEAYCAGSTQ